MKKCLPTSFESSLSRVSLKLNKLHHEARTVAKTLRSRFENRFGLPPQKTVLSSSAIGLGTSLNILFEGGGGGPSIFEKISVVGLVGGGILSLLATGYLVSTIIDERTEKEDNEEIENKNSGTDILNIGG